MNNLSETYPYLMTDKDGFMLQCDGLSYFQSHPRRTRNMFILFCISGNADIMRNLQTFRFEKNMEWTIMYNSIIHIQNPTPDFKVRYCYFAPSLFDEVTMRMEPAFFDFLADNSPFLHTTKKDTERINLVFGLMQMIYEDTINVYRHKIAVNNLQNFLFDLYDKVHKTFADQQHSNYNSKDTLMKHFWELIAKHYQEKREVSFYADKLCVSTRYLSSVTNHLSGVAPKKMINDYITLEIKIQLQSTNRTIQEISQRLNFSDQSVMGRFFKKQTGYSPIDYRKFLLQN